MDFRPVASIPTRILWTRRTHGISATTHCWCTPLASLARQVPVVGAQSAVTGPGGTLLEWVHEQHGWVLFVDGVAVGIPVEDPAKKAAAQQVPQEADFDLYSPVTRDWHQIRATNIGSRGTQFFIDGSLVGGEDYQLSLLALVGSCWNFVGAGVVRCGFSAWTEKVRTTTT